MKSINEKSEDLYPDKKVVLARGNTCLSCGRVKRESFEAGANYVLECIEDIIANNEDNTLNMARCLVDCIEQLKK